MSSEHPPDPRVVSRWAKACAGSEPLSAAELALVDAVEQQFAVDLPELWNVFEPSVSSDSAGVSSLRFSYGFPRRTADEAERLVSAMARPFGTTAVAAATKVSRALTHPATQQIMFGYARDARGAERSGSRVKIYLMMRDGETTAALDLARQLLGYDGPLSSAGLPLHALGIDVGAEGMVGAKLYFHRDEATAAESEAWYGVAAPLRNVLVIHRLRGPNDPGAREPSEVDMDPAENGLSWAQLRGRPPSSHGSSMWTFAA